MPRTDAFEEALAARAASVEVASALEVTAALDRLAHEITAALGNARPVVVAVMQGGIYAAVELTRRFDFPHEFDYVHLTRYGAALRGGQVCWVRQPAAALRGRHVLIVDDILDRGATLAALQTELAALGARRVSTAVLVVKRLATPRRRPAVDFVGLEVDDRYVFGCGMDYKGFWRSLSALYAVEPT